MTDRLDILRQHDPDLDIRFDLDCKMALTTQQRFEIMRRHQRQALEALIRLGLIKPREIVKRPLDQGD